MESIDKVQSSKRMSKDDKDYAENVHNYAIRFIDKFGIGTPTTCTYQFIKLQETIMFLQLFVMEGLGCSIVINDYIGNNFYGHLF